MHRHGLMAFDDLCGCGNSQHAKATVKGGILGIPALRQQFSGPRATGGLLGHYRVGLVASVFPPTSRIEGRHWVSGLRRGLRGSLMSPGSA